MKFSAVACVLGLLVSGSYASNLKGANTESPQDRAHLMANKARDYLSGLTRESVVNSAGMRSAGMRSAGMRSAGIQEMFGEHAHEMHGGKALEVMKSTGSANQAFRALSDTSMSYMFSMSYSMFCLMDCPGLSYFIAGDYATYCDMADDSCVQENCGDIGEAFLNYLCDCFSYGVFDSYSYSMSFDFCEVSEDCAVSTIDFWFTLFSFDFSFSNAILQEFVQVACDPSTLCSYSYDDQLYALFSFDQAAINLVCDCTDGSFDWSYSLDIVTTACLDEMCADSLVDFWMMEMSYSYSQHFWVEVLDGLCENVTAAPTMEPTMQPTIAPGTTHAPTMQPTVGSGGNAGSVVSAGVASFLAVFAATAVMFTF